MDTVTNRPGEIPPERLVQHLERWHRLWEIQNPDKILVPTFASLDDLTHEHQWGDVRYRKYSLVPKPFIQCKLCPIIKSVEEDQ